MAARKRQRRGAPAARTKRAVPDAVVHQESPGPCGAARYETLAVWLLLLGALLVRLPGLNASLWWDELWRTRLGLTGSALWFVLLHGTHPPLFPLILWGWIHVFGDSEISVRLPSLLSGLASIAVSFALAKRWFGRRVAFLTAGLLALSPAHIWYSDENKNNMLLLLLTVTAVWQLDCAWHHGRRRHWRLFLAAAVLGLWTNLFALWSVGAAGLWLWFEAWRARFERTRLRQAVAATLIVGASFLPIALWNVSHFGGLQRATYLRPFTLAEVYKLLLIYLSHGNTLRTVSPYAPLRVLLRQPAAFFLLDAFFACLLLLGIVAVARSLRRPATNGGAPSSLLLFYFIVPLVAVWLASCLYKPIYIERSMLIVLPPYLMLLAVGVFALPRPVLRYGTLVMLLTLNAWAVFNLRVAKADVWTVYKPKNDWRAAAHFLAPELQGNGPPLLLFATAPASVLVYYDGRFSDLSGPEDPGRPGARGLIEYLPADHEWVIAQQLRQRHLDTFYLVEDTYWKNHFRMLLAAVRREPSFELLTKRSFRGIKLFKFRWHASP